MVYRYTFHPKQCLKKYIKNKMGTSLVVQWLRFQPPNAVSERPGFHPWSGNWILHATTKTQHSQIKKNSGNSTNDNRYILVFCSTKINTKPRKRRKEKNKVRGEGKDEKRTIRRKKIMLIHKWCPD